MTIIKKYIQKYSASRRTSFVSQTTTCELNGTAVYRHIPEVKTPVFPVLSAASLFSIFDDKPKNVLDHGYAKIPVIAARYAIAHALEQMNISPGDEILVPAYHCTVMVAPIVEMMCKPVFYKITPDLETDINDLKTKITSRTKAVVAVNYCGFIQNMADVKDLCTEKNIVLIEDCAHSFFGSRNGVTVGGYGDYVLVSARKFFPVSEGGVLLISNETHDLPKQKSPAFIYSLKSFLTIIERSLKYEKLWLLAPFIEIFHFFRGFLKKDHIKHHIHDDTGIAPSEKDIPIKGENTYDHNLMDKKTTLINHLLPGIINSTKIAQRRREYYLWLSCHFKEIPKCRPLIGEIAEGTVPFMVPVYIENLAEHFAAFEDAALPMQRFAQFLWPDMPENICSVTADYSNNVILFPCHQELRQKDLLWMVTTVRNILEQK